jgi:spermidine/putrescine transport system permease protein
LFYVTDVLGGARDLMVGALLKDQFLEARDWPFGSAASLIVILWLFLLMGVYRWAQRWAGMGQVEDV